jgi:hypothetical protein
MGALLSYHLFEKKETAKLINKNPTTNKRLSFFFLTKIRIKRGNSNTVKTEPKPAIIMKSIAY